MTPPQPGEYAVPYQRYIDFVPAGDIFSILANSGSAFTDQLAPLTARQSLARYAPDKWSIREMVSHIIDTERIFAYRALAIARGERVSLPGFEQDDYTRAAEADAVPLRELTDEFRLVRESSIAMFRHLPAQAWDRLGSANNCPITPRALAWIIAGHVLYHQQQLADRYGV